MNEIQYFLRSIILIAETLDETVEFGYYDYEDIATMIERLQSDVREACEGLIRESDTKPDFDMAAAITELSTEELLAIAQSNKEQLSKFISSSDSGD